ncbi:MAG: hypothetical protein AB8B63_07385 [Granulosicoccus sp.]
MNMWLYCASVRACRPVFLLIVLVFVNTPVLAKTYGLVVSGLPGNADYASQFSEWSAAYVDALGSLDTDDNLIVALDESADRDGILDAIAGQAQKIVADEAIAETTTFVLMLLGHGTTDNSTWRFNIKGPDLTTEDLVAALNAVPAQRQLIVLATSASGAALEALAQPGRVVVTATKSGGEVNAVRFPGYFAEAMRGGAADYDRNEILTVTEAYRFAEGQTRNYYEQEKLLASEHSRLRGDGAADIALALLGSLKDARDDPVVATLLDDRLILEQAFQQLKSRKQEMPMADYYLELETLLISIATLQQRIDKATGWSDNDADS